ncbi:MAG TPA: RNA polymerase-binding protein DksA [Rudaea sp.]|jgi:DnaK suppressor protein|nr:RNA polymerase-binding protein DksA [Rudaea sp.]
MVKNMANAKRKPAPAAKKKSASAKAKPAKKASAAKVRKPQKAAKPVRKAAPAPKAKKAAKKVAPAKHAAKKKVAAKPAAKPAVHKSKAAKPVAHKPAKPAAAVKPAAPVKSTKPVHVVPTKHEMPAKKAKMVTASTAANDSLSRDDGRYALPSTVVVNLPAGYHPNAREEYMGPRHLAYFRAKLQKWREDLVEESKQTIDNLRDEVRDVGDEAERATRETENSLELRTRDRYRKLIAKIDKALKRIEEGRYGYCEETDEEIGIERLEARPIATLCLDAQERWEHRQKQMGD